MDAIVGTKVRKLFVQSAVICIALFGAQASADPLYVKLGHIEPRAINSSGEVAGTTTGNNQAGFVRTKDGTITGFTVPGARATEADSINDHGEIAGTYTIGKDHEVLLNGFLREPDGTITTFAYPDSRYTHPHGINQHGDVVGDYIEGDAEYSFLRKSNGKLIAIKPPGSSGCFAYAINATGEISGTYSISSSDTWYGFVRDPSGSFASFSVPDANPRYPVGGAINDNGEIAGTYYDTNFVEHGFVRTPDGTVTEFDAPGATDTVAGDLNGQGVVVGFYTDAAQADHGFIRAADGTITTFDVPGKKPLKTEPFLINDTGEIGGDFYGQGGKQPKANGFLREP